MVSAKTFHHTAHMRKPFLLLWINWKGKNCHLQMLNFFCYLMWENFCHLKFCHNRINPLDSCSEAWTLVCSRWPTVYLPISIPHNFSPIFFQNPYLFLRLLLFTTSARLSSLFVHFPFSSDPNTRTRAVLLGSYYTYWSYYTYCSEFFRYFTIISTVWSQKMWIVLFISITALPFLLYVLFWFS